MAEVHGQPGIHLHHAAVAQGLRPPSHGDRDKAIEPAAGPLIDRKNLIETVDVLEHLGEQEPVQQTPVHPRMNGIAEPDVHVGPLEHEIAFDQQLLFGFLAEIAAEQLGSLAQEIVAGVDGIKRDVCRHHEGRLSGCSDQGIDVLEPEGAYPPIEPVRLAGLFHGENALLEDFQHQRQRRCTLTVPERRRMQKAERSAAGGNVAILDHAAFREKNDLSAAQNFRGEKRQQAREVVGYRAAAAEKIGECFVAEKELVGRDATAIGAGRLVDEILGDDGLEAREVIEQKYLASLDVAVGVVNLDVDAQAAARQRECPHAPLIQPLIDLQLGIPAHCASAEAVHRSNFLRSPTFSTA